MCGCVKCQAAHTATRQLFQVENACFVTSWLTLKLCNCYRCDLIRKNPPHYHHHLFFLFLFFKPDDASIDMQPSVDKRFVFFKAAVKLRPGAITVLTVRYKLHQAVQATWESKATKSEKNVHKSQTIPTRRKNASYCGECARLSYRGPSIRT